MPVPRPGADAAYVWFAETAEWDAVLRIASIDRVIDFHPARHLYRVIHGLEREERATGREIASFFGFDDYASIPRDWIVAFVREVKALRASTPGDAPPDGWDEEGSARFPSDRDD